MRHPTGDQWFTVIALSSLGPLLVAEKSLTIAFVGFVVCLAFYGSLAYLGANGR